MCWASPRCHRLCDTWTLQELTDSRPLLSLAQPLHVLTRNLPNETNYQMFIKGCLCKTGITDCPTPGGWAGILQTRLISFLFLFFSKQSVSASNVELPKGHNDSELQGWGFRLALLLVVMGAVAAHYVGRDAHTDQPLINDFHSVTCGLSYK